MNAAYAAVGKRGGFFAMDAEVSLDMDAAGAAVEGNEFIFDVQGHFVNPTGAWTRRLPPDAKPTASFEQSPDCVAGGLPGNLDRLQCFGPDTFVRDIFLDSDTSLMVLSFVPSTREGEPVTIEEAAATAGIVERMQGTHRLFLHGRVNPNQPGDEEDMDRLAAQFPIRAWKTYTQWGPEGAGGFWLDDEPGIALIEKARALDIRNIAVHKGLSFGQRSYQHSTCADVGRVASRYPGGASGGRLVGSGRHGPVTARPVGHRRVRRGWDRLALLPGLRLPRPFRRRRGPLGSGLPGDRLVDRGARVECERGHALAGPAPVG